MPHTLSWLYIIFPVVTSCFWGRRETRIGQPFVHSEGKGEGEREFPETMEPGRNDRTGPLCPLLLHKPPLSLAFESPAKNFLFLLLTSFSKTEKHKSMEWEKKCHSPSHEQPMEVLG